jgi:ketosteroid isomerase-like protein
MAIDQTALATLVAKEEIRQLVLLYSRGVDRKDIDLLRSLYAKDATDHHGSHFDGSAEDYMRFLERSFPYMRMSGHYVCNHLISVNGDAAEGEVYALAYHLIPDGKGGTAEDFAAVRYIDRYRKEDGRWLFAKRVVEFDLRSVRPVATPEGAAPVPTGDASYATLSSRLFARGARA